MPVYNKLVRDLIPDIIAAQGKQYSTTTLDAVAYAVELRKKLWQCFGFLTTRLIQYVVW
ncbi:hypothetical protein [Paenibacillus dokdonensis]|uniref:hypothetical protein n=1 Tax=Paenibacillus dokdonensis TaxID=2567944 RepID=UPI001B3C7167|nr:hypothetical protein [Paenibacillus dokdonensis]